MTKTNIWILVLKVVIFVLNLILSTIDVTAMVAESLYATAYRWLVELQNDSN